MYNETKKNISRSVEEGKAQAKHVYIYIIIFVECKIMFVIHLFQSVYDV